LASPQSSPDSLQQGVMQSTDTWGDVNGLVFAIKQVMNKIQTSTPVKVISCTNSGGLSPVGFVNVVPMVNLVDCQGKSWPHGVLTNIPYSRIQGGTNAIIIDPKPGDIGVCLFASNDISSVIRNKEQSNPGSYRKFDYQDGIYIPSILNSTPTQYVQFTDTGITITALSTVTINAPSIVLNGTVTATGDVTGAGTSLHTHVHGGVTTGSGDTGQPA
jgi:Phage protein Gp138 N-terminal domain